MANPLYGFSLYKSPTVNANQEYSAYGKNSVAFTLGDPVAVDGTNGLVLFTTSGSGNATQEILGIAAKTVTMSSTNQTVAQVQPPYIPVDQDMVFLAGTDADMSNLTCVGQLFKISSGPTGQFLVATSSGTQTTGVSGLVLCLGVDPANKGTTGLGGGSREGLFRIVKASNRTSGS